MLFWISLILALGAAACIAVLLARKWKEIRLLDTDTIRAEQERRARDRIVRDRFERMLKRWSYPIRRTGKSLAKRLGRSVLSLEGKLKRASNLHECEFTDTPSGSAKETPDRITRILQEAQVLAREGKVNRAERAFLEVLKLDVRNVDAYRGLGALYLNDRQYKQAKETYDFLLTINGADDAVYAGMAAIADVDGDVARAEDMRKRALAENPKSPRRHAELAEHYLKYGSPEYAREFARKASDMDPKSPRYLELSVETAILVRDREEAEKRYERLRLMGYDRSKLQRLKERLDSIE